MRFWQYYHGFWVVLRSAWANKWGKGYADTLEDSDAWDDFNVEERASLVEDWFDSGMSTIGSCSLKRSFGRVLEGGDLIPSAGKLADQNALGETAHF